MFFFSLESLQLPIVLNLSSNTCSPPSSCHYTFNLGSTNRITDRHTFGRSPQCLQTHDLPWKSSSRSAPHMYEHHPREDQAQGEVVSSPTWPSRCRSLAPCSINVQSLVPVPSQKAGSPTSGLSPRARAMRLALRYVCMFVVCGMEDAC